MPDLQCAWQILLQSAGPRANHTLRTLPPKLSADYAQGHDEGMWNTATTLLGEVPGTAEAVREAECVAKLPMRMGGLGLRSAVRCVDAAYWASWADALHMIHERTPTVADLVVRTMDGGLSDVGCLAELKQATDRLENDPQRSQPRTLASGLMVGSIGHLPFPTPMSGSALCCQAVLLLTEPI